MSNRRILIHRDSLQEVRDKKYGLPELKKYPMPDADHVRSAIRFFNYVEPHNEEKLAKAILNRMKEYGMTFDEFTVGKENRFSKYIPEQSLSHHGILGQKWGEENGPPYPLDYDSHSTAEKQKNPDSKIGGGNGAMSKKEISRTLGFDLSKYSFESVFSKDGVNRNVERNFQMFGFSVKELIAQQGEAGAIEYLQKEWGFSKEDAESAVRNLDKVWQDHTIKDKDDDKDKTKKSSSKSSGGSQKAAKAEQSKEENKDEEAKSENDGSDNQYALEYLTAISEHYDDYVKEYDTLKQEEKDLLESEHGVEDADGYAQYAAKNELVEKFKMSDEVAESIVMVYRESLSDAKGSIENDKEAIELVSKIIEASNTIDTLSNLKAKKKEARGLKHTDIGDAFVDLYLVHHGIEGQKWGVTNGPPYPLDYDDHSAAEKKKSPRSELDNYGPPKQQSFFQRHKKAIIVGGALAAVAAVAIGSNYVKTKKENQRLTELLEQANKKKDTFDPDSFLKKVINPNKPIKEVMPGFDKAKSQLALPSHKSSGKTKDFFKTVFAGWENPFKHEEPSKAAKAVESKLTEVIDFEIIEPNNNSFASRGADFVQRIQASAPLLIEDKQMKG